MRESNTSLVERNRVWRGQFATEPFETAWATEAIFFIRALETREMRADTRAKVQISPDGIRWCDEGTEIALPISADDVSFARLSHFGGWLRLIGELPSEAEIRVITYLVLKA